MLIQLSEIVTALYDRLRTDTRTSGLTWHDGRRTILMIEKVPAGVVGMALIKDMEWSIPAGRNTDIDLLVGIITRNEKVSVAEHEMYDWVDKVLEVITGNRDIISTAPNVMAEVIDVTFDSLPEADPPEARAQITVHAHAGPF